MIAEMISIAGSLASVFGAVSAVKSGNQARETILTLEGIRGSIERLSDNILIANAEIISDPSLSTQKRINDFRKARECLEPAQRALGSTILSSSLIAPPIKLQEAMKANPWHVLVDVRPLNRATTHHNPDMVPVIFEDNGVQYLGWQLRGTIPMLFGIDYKPDLWVPNSSSPSGVVTNSALHPSQFSEKQLQYRASVITTWRARKSLNQMQINQLRLVAKNLGLNNRLAKQVEQHVCDTLPIEEQQRVISRQERS